jgi:hypothetical protein
MNTPLVLGILVFIAAFGAVYAVNSGSTQFAFTPPYYYVNGGDLASVLNSMLFVFLFSLLFFGLGAPLALGIEGLKYSSLYLAQAIPFYDLFYILPQFIAAYAATILGTGALADFQGNASVFDYWKDGVKYFLVALGLTAILLVLRPYVSLPV